ncbi:hypothetical protein H4R33_001892 [Dimargaris cristalligena]|nr:hypothetical protein H4R33_001892 [Dimargaris cristalligena]
MNRFPGRIANLRAAVACQLSPLRHVLLAPLRCGSRELLTASSAVRVGTIIEIDSQHWTVLRRDFGGTGRGVGLIIPLPPANPHYDGVRRLLLGMNQMELKNVLTDQKKELRCKADTEFEVVHLTTRPFQFLYSTDTSIMVMNNDTYDELEIPLNIIQDGMTIQVQFDEEGSMLSAQLPKRATYRVLKVTQKIAQAKGNTMCPAELENGPTVAVPDFVKADQMVVVDLTTLEYVSRG